jgi:hypothetical protein
MLKDTYMHLPPLRYGLALYLINISANFMRSAAMLTTSNNGFDSSGPFELSIIAAEFPDAKLE